MSTFAILGATGQTGSSILTILLQNPTNKIHCLVRSKAKLLTQNPSIATNSQVTIYEGSVSDHQTLTACITDVQAVFLAAAQSAGNKPNTTIAQETASAVLAALAPLRTQKNTKIPRLVVLSSASLSEHLCRDMPALAHSVMLTAASYIYADLRLAEEMLRAESDWISTVFIKPGGLVHDAQRGHALSTERQQTFVSYLDLAAGMVEVAEAADGVWEGKDVSVVPTAKDVKIEWRVPLFVVLGVLSHYFPWLYPYLPN